MSNSVNITGSDFGELTKALSTINTVAARSFAKIQSMFQLDATGSKLFASLDALNGKLAVARIRADGLATALKGLKGIGSIKVISGGGSGGAGGGVVVVPAGAGGGVGLRPIGIPVFVIPYVITTMKGLILPDAIILSMMRFVLP